MSVETNENGRFVVDAEETFGLDAGGYLHAYGRAESMAELEAAFLAEGLYEEITREDGTTVARPLPHIHVHVYEHTITQGTYDADGNELTPPVIDPRPHFNLRIHAARRDQAKLFATLKKWMAQGTDLPPEAKNRSENGKKLGPITLLEPGTFEPTIRWQA